MLTNEYEYNEFGKKAFYEKLKCLLTDVISFLWWFYSMMVKLLLNQLLFFNLLLKWQNACCFTAFQRCYSKCLGVDRFCSYFVCSCAAQVSCCYFSSTYGLVTFGTYISNSSSTFYTIHKFQINSRMNNSYDQQYISIDILLKKSQILSMHF